MMMRRKFTRALATIVVSASISLAGCSGGGSALPHAAGSSTSSHAGMGKASFTIHWPAKAIASVKAGRTPKFISPSALAVVVEVNPNASTAGPVTFANANGSATSTVTIDAPAGSDEFVFTLWDQQQTAGETAPVGNILGQADVAGQNIVAGQVNTVNATIGGITNSITIAPTANQPLVETDASIAGYDLVGDGAATFAATAYDADGNVIIAPGAPTLSFAASSASAGSLSVTPVATNANEFTVTPTAPYGSAAPAAVVVTATDSGVTHTATANLPLSIRSAIYVSYANGSGTRIALYDDRGNSMPLATGAFAGLTSPAGLAYSPTEHRLFVADSGSGQILAFNADGSAVSGYTPATLAGAHAVEYDPQSDAVFATGTSQVLAINPDGSTKALASNQFSQTATPDGIAYLDVGQYSAPGYDVVAVANDATSKIDYYNASTGAYMYSDTLATPAVAPITNLAFIDQSNLGPGGIKTVIVATGGVTPGAGWGIMTATGYGFNLDHTTSTTTRFAGVAFASTVYHTGVNPTFAEMFVAQPDSNQIQGYIRDQNANRIFSASYVDILISTPATSGLSTPMGVAAAL